MVQHHGPDEHSPIEHAYQPGRVRPGTAYLSLDGRELLIVQCLVWRATEQGTDEPGLTLAELVRGTAQYAGTVHPAVEPAEVAALLMRLGAITGAGDEDRPAPVPVPSPAGYGGRA